MEVSREELEEIVDKKVEERLKQRETARNESETRGKTAQKESDSTLSRRSFLKALGGGAAGLGAAAMIPSAAGLRVNSNKGLSYYNSSSANKSQFEVGPNGVLDAQQIGTDKNPVGSIHSETTNTGELSGIADHIVTTTPELESTFGNLSAGDTVWIGAPSTPYRTTQWLDIDVDGVTVVAQSTHAGDGQPIIKVADGANVGGVRVGSGSTTTENVDVVGIGYHGNPLNQDGAVKRLHGVILDNTADCSVRDCFATRTHPYQEHNSGGSGVSVTSRTSDYVVDNCWFDDIGDRGVQTAGRDGFVTRIRSRNGYDRTIALDLEEDDGTAAAADHAVVNGVIARDNSEGSIVGWGGGGNPTGRYLISNVLATGGYRSAIRAIDNSAHWIGVNNVIAVGTGVGARIDGSVDILSMNNVLSTGQINIAANRCLMGNILVQSPGNDGILVDGGGEFFGGNISILDPGGVGFFNREANEVAIDGLFVRGADEKGLADNDAGTRQRFSNVDIAGSVNEDVDVRGTDTSVSGKWDTVSDTGTRTRLNGIGTESASAETPTASDWDSGNVVDFTDTGDGSGTDRYIRLPATFTDSWVRLSDGALV